MKLITIQPGMLKGTIKISKNDFLYGAALLVAGAIGNDVICECDFDYSKEFSRIFDVIENSGGEIERGENWCRTRSCANMKGVIIDAEGQTDILPIIAILCAFCKGESRIRGVAGIKEREILKGIASELRHLGIKTEITIDGLSIEGRQTINCDGAYVWKNPYLAIALMVAASRCEGELRLMGTDELPDEKFNDFMKIYKQLIKEDIR